MKITLYLDYLENKSKKTACVQDYIMTDPTMPGLSDWFEELRIINAPRPKPEDRLAKAPGYQAADFLEQFHVR
jgi:hypothetical protein